MLNETEILIVPEEAAGMRLDMFLSGQFPEQSRSFLQKQIKEGNVRLKEPGKPEETGHPGEAGLFARTGKAGKPGMLLRAGDVIMVQLPAPKELEVLPEEIPLDILYEDEDLLVVNKPKSMVVHPAPGHESGTLVNALMWHCRDRLSGINGVLRPGIVHRIDADTTGSLIVCKSDRAHAGIAAQLEEHSIHRRYEAIVHGRLSEKEGTIDAPIGRHPVDRKRMAVRRDGYGKNAVTHYRVLHSYDRFTHIECRLETGRTHQIRVHLSSIGHPLLGDGVYGSSVSRIFGMELRGQTLHAKTIGFVHPVTGEYMEFEAPLPEYFTFLLQKLGG